ncbi:drebrin-like protein [Diaphorina citri]|uniref:Drebrin-like protein n=1 Tax=Diaphorina citri TaxID=121845 RepID=A0A1S3D8G5_DIACI|nr:drebrin-like protein [Diaphorina citri]
MSINLDKHKDSLVKAWRDVLDDKTSTDWALFGYEGQTYDLKVVSTGDGGIEEMREDLNGGKIMYGFCKVIDVKTSLPKYVLINWQGEGAPPHMKGTCVNHLRHVQAMFKGAHITYNARTEEEVDEELISEKVARSSASTYSFVDRSQVTSEPNHPVSAQYTRIIPSKEINTIERDKFWAAEEEKEKLRQETERRKKEEEMRRLEEERINREMAEMVKRDSEPEPVKPDTPLGPSEQIVRENTVKQLSQQILQGNRQGPSELATTKPLDELHTRGPSQQIQDNAVKEPVPIQDDVNTPNEQVELGSPKENGVESNVVPEEQNGVVETEEDVGLQAQALYDYQAADDTEISFEPGDILTHIDQIDAGWWQGLAPDGTYGLFPANYVQLL